jgi:Lrp/AsnC family transcriptional regulator for asnA, asnC and gidA
VDEIDRKLILLLSENGRLKNNELADQLAVSEGTVRNRLKRLSSSGNFRVRAMVNSEAVTDKQLVILGIKVAVTRDLKQIADQIAQIPEVDSVMITSGRFDIMIEAWVQVKSGLIQFIDGHLAKVEGIVSTESFMVMKSYDKWLKVPEEEN